MKTAKEIVLNVEVDVQNLDKTIRIINAMKCCGNCGNMALRDKELNCKIEDMYFKQIEKPCQHWKPNKKVIGLLAQSCLEKC